MKGENKEQGCQARTPPSVCRAGSSARQACQAVVIHRHHHHHICISTTLDIPCSEQKTSNMASSSSSGTPLL